MLLLTPLCMVFVLRRRVRKLEETVASMQANAAVAAIPQAPQAGTATVQQVAPSALVSAATQDAPAVHVAAKPIPTQPPTSVPELPVTTPPRNTAPAPDSTPTPVVDMDQFIDRALARARHWFMTGNIPVKVGMLILLAGVAALLKYASDQGWLRLPVELRLAGISAAALAALGFAWIKRTSHRSFALPVQGASVGTLLLVIFAALKLYALLDTRLAFALSVLLIAALAVLAVLQDALALAILGVLAGFMAPIWLSDGSGSHVALFAWYALLNGGVFLVAWIKPWRSLNLLGFIFTWGIASAWGVLQYHPAEFWTAQAFLALFFAFYLLLPLCYARRTVTTMETRIDGTLLFGTPLIALSLQAGLLAGERLPLALIALGLGTLYTLLAWGLRQQQSLQRLAQGYAILALAFTTLAIPLAMSAHSTAVIFALEGAGLVWLGLAQQRRVTQWTGLALQLVAAIAFFYGSFAELPFFFFGSTRGRLIDGALAFASPAFVSALLITLAGWGTAWLHRRAGHTWLALATYLWGLLWWLGNLYGEIHAFVPWHSQLHALLLLCGVTGWFAAQAYRHHAGHALALTTLISFLFAGLLALQQYVRYDTPLAGFGAWIWPLFALLGWHSLRSLRGDTRRIASLACLIWWLLWPVVLSLSAWDANSSLELASGWGNMMLALPWLLLAGLATHRWAWLCLPLGKAFDDWRPPLGASVFAVLGLWWLACLPSAGNSAPLPWIPLLNPLELAQLAVLVLLAPWLGRHMPRQVRHTGLTLAGGLLLSTISLRGVHHWGDVPWNMALLATSLAQTTLTLVWSALGVLAWVAGSRRGHWGLWLGGAVLMGIVLAKLLLIDRGNLGNLLGITAFLAYGLLCTLLGWLAPAPPRRATPLQTGAT